MEFQRVAKGWTRLSKQASKSLDAPIFCFLNLCLNSTVGKLSAKLKRLKIISKLLIAYNCLLNSP